MEEFYTFRYELNTIFRKHYYQDEEPSELFPLGRHPLSKKNGKPLKALPAEVKQNCQDMYMPPGIVNDKSKKLSAEIRMAIP